MMKKQKQDLTFRRDLGAKEPSIIIETGTGIGIVISAVRLNEIIELIERINANPDQNK